MFYIDSHCHLQMIDLEPFHNDFDQMMQKTFLNNVRHMLCVSTNLDDWPKMVDLTKLYPHAISFSVGIHPSEVLQATLPTYEDFAPMLAHEKTIAVGETGLDYYRGKESKKEQQAFFARQIEIAREAKKPLIVHTRDAREDTLNILKSEKAEEVGAVLHCFTENWEMARKALDQGYYLSFSGIITFNSAHELRDIVKKTPLDRLLIETDSPYLSPAPYRGEINFPGRVLEVAKMVAAQKKLPLEAIGEVTRENFNRLFKQTI